MKKIAFFCVAIIIIVSGISYMYLNYKANYNISQKTNKEFEKYLDTEIYGKELSTVINKAIDSNEKNDVEKNNKGIYINNNENSINIEIKIVDDNTIYKMETFYKSGIQNFIKYYGNIKFKCTKIDYHNLTYNIKYMLFEQITD